MQFLKSALDGLLLRAQLRCGDVLDWFRETERSPELAADGAGVLTTVMPLEQRRVLSVAPVVAAPLAVNEGDAAVLTFDFTDTDSTGVFTIDIDWDNDGTFDETTDLDTSSDIGNTHTFSTAAPFSTDDDGSFPISIRVTDNNGDVGTLADTSFVVENVAPTIALSGAASVDEGSPYTLTLGAVTDPGTDTVTAYIVNWGDGTSDTFNTAGDKMHTYVDGPDTLSITVDLVDEDGTHTGAGTLDVTINNVAPTIALSGAASVDEGAEYTLTLGAVTDPGADTVTEYIVDWGDGMSDTFTTAGDKTHTYADGTAARTITVDLVDEDGTHTAAGTLDVTVNNVAPTIALTGAASVDEGSLYTLTLGAVTDPGDDTVTSYIVHWGDGMSDTYSTAGNKTHTYADGPLSAAITVDLVDEDGTYIAAGSLDVTVNNVAPAIDAKSINVPVIAVNDTATLTFEFTDPGLDDTFTVFVDWQDGNGFVEVAGTITPSPITAGRYTFTGESTVTFPDTTPPRIRIEFYVVDNDGDSSQTASADLTVNSPLVVTGATSIDEGSTETLSISVTVPRSVKNDVTVSIDWGDGTVDTLAPQSKKTFTVMEMHTYPDDGEFDIVVEVLDGNTVLATQGLHLIVNNVAPTIALSGAASVDEGSVYTLTLGAVTDPGDDTVTSYTVHWGDGTSDTYATAGDKTHTYADGSVPPATATITVDLVDEDGTHTAAGTLDVMVNNVAPTIELTGAASVDEGSLYTLTLGAVTDPGDDMVTEYIVHWGDGTSETFTTAGDKTHTYADGPLSPVITVDLVDDDGTHAAAGSLDVTVNNVAPTIEISGPQIVDEGAYTLTLGAVTDPGDDTVTSYIVHWGDGTSDTYTSAGDKIHRYDGPLFATITVDLADEDGRYPAVASLDVTVNNVAPTIELIGADNVDEGSPYTLTLGAVTDPGDDTVTSYIVHWGDGTSDTYTTGGDKTHTYADGPLSATITVDLVDEDGSYMAAGTLDVTVNDVAPTIALAGVDSLDEGSWYTLTLGAVTDPGTDTVMSYIVHWGDEMSDTFTTAGDKTHFYADGPLSADITVDLVDEDGTHPDAGSLGVTVNNVAPTIELLGAASVDEGSPYTLTLGAVTDPGDDTVMSYIVHWGDGTSDTFTTPGNKTHAYVDGTVPPATAMITVDLVDDDFPSVNPRTDAGLLNVTVNNVAPTIPDSPDFIFATDVDPNTGETTLTVRFYDPGLVDDPFSPVINWGDSRGPVATRGGPVEVGGGWWLLTVSHQYVANPLTAGAMRFVINVTIQDKDSAVSNTGTAVAQANQGIQFPSVATGIAPPALNLRFPPVSTPVADAPSSPPPPLALQSARSSNPSVLDSSESHVEIWVVRDGEDVLQINLERPGDDGEQQDWSIANLDDILDRLEGMPANQYRVYLVKDGVKRTIVDVVIREGRVQEAEDFDDPLDAARQRMEQAISQQIHTAPPEAPMSTDGGESSPAADAVPLEAGAGTN